MPNNIANGIKKVNENILSLGRALIITEQDKDQYSWSDIPVGSKFINTTDGTEYVKLVGESDWVPSKIKNDGTLSIAKDSIVKVETFKIVTLDEGDGNFCYSNSKDELRHMPFNDDGYVFELEEGSYQEYRNHLDVLLDDCLIRNAASGGLEEVTPRRFILKSDLVEGEEITARYINTIRLGNPYPRIFESEETPEEQDSEVGDLWIQYNYTMQDADRYKDKDGKIDWTIIKNTPKNLAGYGIEDPVSLQGHRHSVDDITDFPTIVPKAELANEARKLTGFQLNLAKDLSGSVNIDGANDVVLNATIDPEALAEALKVALSDPSVIDAIRSRMPIMRIQGGSFYASEGSYVPLPNGSSDRSNCYFIVNSNDGNIITIDETGKVISSNNPSSAVNFLSIELQNRLF